MRRFRAAFSFKKNNRHTCPSTLGNEVLTDTCGSNQNTTFRSFHQDVQELRPAAEGGGQYLILAVGGSVELEEDVGAVVWTTCMEHP